MPTDAECHDEDCRSLAYRLLLGPLRPHVSVCVHGTRFRLGYPPDPPLVPADWVAPLAGGSRCPAHHEDEPCQTCAAYIAGGL